jgi:hypothetical protein
MGLGPTGPVRRQRGLARAVSSARLAVVTVHRPLTVVQWVWVHWRLAWDKVFVWSTSAESGRRLARRGPVGLTEGVGH